MIEMAEQQTEALQKLDAAALTIVEKVEALAVVDQESKDDAVLFGQHIVTEIGARVAFFKPMKDAAHLAHKVVCDQEREKVTQLKTAKDDLAQKIIDWNAEQDRLAEEARKKAAAEQAQRDQERRDKEAAEQAERDHKLKEAEDREAEKQRKLDEAAALKRKGDEEAAALLEQQAADEQQRADDLVEEAAASEAAEPEPEPEPVQPEVIAPAKTKGGVERKVYSANVFDEVLLIKAVVDGKAPRRCIVVDQAYMDKLAKMDKEDINKIPGVELKVESKQDFKKL